ncbi:hypothetical protein [Fredinandcohnia quinoae]|uniref:Uncharacterized protein n=1 Tax=Fredinandcohnia quinoae TaxID=2918902 RepID=A0AAW5ED42_9BACI|nr:hypothetical protein [Fredinandcohnia sp. SECRCQ15]MCH1627981.1 hypothetical protein [Fredinandcohnia sp. SECRCQ15]
MTSPIFYNNQSAPYVFQAPTKSNLQTSNQPTYYANFILEHMKKQDERQKHLRQNMKKNEVHISKLLHQQEHLQNEFFENGIAQRERDAQISKKMTDQKSLLEVFVGFMKKQEKQNERTARRQADHYEQLEILQQIVKNQEQFNHKVTENIALVKEQFEQILVSLREQENVKENLAEVFNDKNKEMSEHVKEQKDIFNKVIQGLQENKDQYDILFDYVRNQDNFNHKLFEYLCEQFSEEKAVNH